MKHEFFHWPDHVIGKRESRQIREAHNAALNDYHELLEALKAVEARLTAVARAFYVDGKAKALKAAFDGWKDDIDPARAAIAKAEGQQ